MIHFYTYDTSGKVVARGSCMGTDYPVLEAKAVEEGLNIAQGEAPRSACFVDSVGVVQLVGVAPSPAHQFDYSVKAWVDPRTLQDHRDEKWAQIKAARDAVEFGPFTWDASIFDADAESQQRISGAVQMASLSSAFSIDWTLADNTVRALTATQVIALGIALAQHVGAAYATARALRDQINAAATIAAVEAIVWP